MPRDLGFLLVCGRPLFWALQSTSFWFLKAADLEGVENPALVVKPAIRY